jgi:hypothetical protein
MLLKMPSIFNQIPEYYGGLSLILWIVSMVAMFLGFVLFIREGIKTELKSQKMGNYSYGVFLLLSGFTRIFFVIGFYIQSDYDFWTLLGYISIISGIVFWLYVLETHLVKKTKRIFTLISLIALSFAFLALFNIIERDLALEIQYILMPASVAIIAILYFYLIAKTTGTVRKKVIGIIIGLVLFALAQIMDGQTFIGAFPDFPLIVAPIIMIAGVFTFIGTQLFYKR